MLDKYNISDIELSRGKKKKSKYVIMRENTLQTMKEVEYFLGNWRKIFKGIRLYKILK